MEWIPVTERLPENDDTVLIMWQDALGTVQAATAYYEAEDEEWYSNVVSALLYTDEILAWIPLPTMTLTSTPALVPDVANDTPIPKTLPEIIKRFSNDRMAEVLFNGDRELWDRLTTQIPYPGHPDLSRGEYTPLIDALSGNPDAEDAFRNACNKQMRREASLGRLYQQMKEK